MNLIDDAGLVWHQLWTVRLAALEAVLAAGGTAYEFYTPGGSIWFPLAVFLIAVAIGLARVIKQKRIRRGDR